MNYVNIETLYPHMTRENAEKARAALPSLRGVICEAFPYFCGREEGNISLYARGEDYHKTVIKRLSEKCEELKSEHPENVFLPYADVSPFPEVLAAVFAGLGVLGENGLLITPEYGSFVFIGIIATDLYEEGGRELKKCEGCGRCIKACPSGALSENGFCIDKCVSELTQRKGELTFAQEELIKNSPTVWGCDLCQLVCPHNEGIPSTGIEEFSSGVIKSLSREEIDMSNRAFREKYKDRAFSWRGVTPLLRNFKIKEK
ncbi:MAG: epoxyqueuosine reductase [Clostridia bacterium]|nr:epoxyqueuosine reductase [Clostridia bacterium]